MMSHGKWHTILANSSTITFFCLLARPLIPAFPRQVHDDPTIAIESNSINFMQSLVDNAGFAFAAFREIIVPCPEWVGYGRRCRPCPAGILDLKREIKGQGKSSPSSASIETFGDALRLYAERKIVIPIKEKGRFERLQAELGPVPIRDLSGKLENYLKLAGQFPFLKTKRLLSNGSINKLLILIKAAFNLASG
jgi:hypothetical protein